MPKYIKYLILIIIITIATVIFIWHPHAQTDKDIKVDNKPVDRIVKIPIKAGSTYGSLMTTAGISAQTANQIYKSALDLYDLAKIHVGRDLKLVYDAETDDFKQFIYEIDTEDELVVTMHYPEPVPDDPETAVNSEEVVLVIQKPEWKAEIKPIPYEIKIKTVQGKITSSLYQSAMDNKIDERAIIELANVFQWTLDFAMDTRIGDDYKFIYEERYLDGKYIMPGKILAGRYTNIDNNYYAFYFEENENNKGYFDENGNSVQKMFLKAPVEFKYISSGYTTGPRVIMEFGLVGPHRAIDYAAPIGTPIRTVGDGIVVFTGWKRGYGNFTSIRHNGTYTTNYAHQSKILVHRGQRVKQGEIIGKVGSTGFSTGPHLHFEMVKNGAKINPLKEVLPPGKAIKPEHKNRFFDKIKTYRKKLDKK